MDNRTILNIIRRACQEVHSHLEPGFLESVYQKALIVELRLKGLKAEPECGIDVFYKDVNVGSFRCDILVEDKIIVEIKAIASTTIAHSAQLVNYLKTTGLNDGVLVNFGSPQLFVMHKTRDYKKNLLKSRQLM